MPDVGCTGFLQWALPRLGLRWAGFARVRRQVCKRLGRRVSELGLADFAAYREYVIAHDVEWGTVESCCHVTISRFFRDAAIFGSIARELLPELAEQARTRGAASVRTWSAGCGAGEEPYSLALAWRFAVAPQFPQMSFSVIATDIDEGQIRRAQAGCYRPSALSELPAAWRAEAFVPSARLLCLKLDYRQGVAFERQDMRSSAPRGPFDLILCRNVAFTYFDDAQQRQMLTLFLHELGPGGALVVGRNEKLPARPRGLEPWRPGAAIYRLTSEEAIG